MQAITRPTRETALSFINAWTDTRQVRHADSKAYALLNDNEQPVQARLSTLSTITKSGPCHGASAFKL
jgi:hypothetical protein